MSARGGSVMSAKKSLSGLSAHRSWASAGDGTQVADHPQRRRIGRHLAQTHTAIGRHQHDPRHAEALPLTQGPRIETVKRRRAAG